MSARILLVDDEEAFTRMLSLCLEAEGYTVVTASRADRAVAAMKADVFDIAFTDIRMETDTAGYAVVRTARALPRPPAVVILSAFPLPQDLEVDAAISKPTRLDVLLQLVSELLQKRVRPAAAC